jgi:hypothetical protein
MKDFIIPRGLLIKLWTERYTLEIAIAGALLTLFILMGFLTWLHMTAPKTIAARVEYALYLERVQRANSTDAGKRAWQRLHRLHGSPGAVIYQPGRTPYYVDRQWRNCSFI